MKSHTQQGITTLTFEGPKAPITLTESNLQALEDHLIALEKNPPQKLIITCPQGLAGADIESFVNHQNPETLVHLGYRVCRRLQQFPAPTVFVIQQKALGGGLEIALSCQQVIAHPHDQLGFPEVRLGILPGWGGYTLAKARVGDIRALKLCLEGRLFSGQQAHAWGLVDFPKTKSPSRRPFSLPTWVRRLIAFWIRRKLPPLPAPKAIVELFVNPQKDPTTSCIQLLKTPEARYLAQAFLLKKTHFPKSQIQQVHCLGAGTMGQGIAKTLLQHGYRVSLSDPHTQALESFFTSLPASLQNRLMLDPQNRGAQSADLIIETVPEEVALKRQCLQLMESVAKPEALIATNTSSLTLDSIAASMKNPNRLVGLHFFNPADIMPLVEIVLQQETPARAQLESFVQSLKKRSVVVQNTPGFVVNHVLMAYMAEALWCLEDGYHPRDIDLSATSVGFPIGPLALADKVGLDVCLKVMQQLPHPLPKRQVQRLTHWVENNHLGDKTHQGFYPTSKRWRPRASTACQERLLYTFLLACVDVLNRGLINNEQELHAAILFGTGFGPHRGSPLEVIRTLGVPYFHERCLLLERLNPPPLETLIRLCHSHSP